MHFDKIIRTPVGADLSRPPPIYRPRWIFRSPDYCVNLHNRAPTKMQKEEGVSIP